MVVSPSFLFSWLAGKEDSSEKSLLFFRPAGRLGGVGVVGGVVIDGGGGMVLFFQPGGTLGDAGVVGGVVAGGGVVLFFRPAGKMGGRGVVGGVVVDGGGGIVVGGVVLGGKVAGSRRLAGGVVLTGGGEGEGRGVVGCLPPSCPSSSALLLSVCSLRRISKETLLGEAG